MIIWVATAFLTIAAVTLGILLLGPVVSKLDSLASQSREAKAALGRLEASAIGEEFERDLRMFAARRTEKAQEVEMARARLANRLDAPFRGMKLAPGASRPAADEFQRAYNFNGDQLRGRIRDFVSRAGGPDVRDIPLISPKFQPGAALDEPAMRRFQRTANVEARVLESAAKCGAAPTAAITIDEEPPPADDADAGYERLRIGLELLVPEGRSSQVVHGLLACFDDAGGITRLVGLSEAPVSEVKLKEQLDAPTKRLAVTLSLGFPTPIEEAP
jgi:hypothetical protein